MTTPQFPASKKPLSSILVVAALAILLVAVPSLYSTYTVFLLTLIASYVVAAQGLNLLMGFTGQISLGHAGFCAIGAYACGYAYFRAGWPFLLALLVGLALPAIVGFLLGYASLEMAGPYLALTTIGFGVIVSIIARSWRVVTMGPDGLGPLPPPVIGPLIIRTMNQRYFVAIAIAFLVTLAVYNLIGTRVGRALMSVRDDPIAASGLGVNIVYYRVLAFTGSALLAGLAGIMISNVSGGVFPTYFDTRLSGVFLASLMLGGRGTVLGPIFGCSLVVTGFEMLRRFREYQMMLYSAAVILVVMFLPGGFMQFIGIARSGGGRLVTRVIGSRRLLRNREGIRREL